MAPYAYDDLEVVNPLGAFHGTHKLGMFYWMSSDQSVCPSTISI